jgi:spermidine synthase
MCSVNPALMSDIKSLGQYCESACSSDTASIYKINDVFFAGCSAACEEIVIASNPEYGQVLFLDKELQSASSDEAIYHEHLIHPVMNAVEGEGLRVLIVGGGEGATAREVLKWSSVTEVVWVEIDEALVRLCRRHLAWATDSVYNDRRLTFLPQNIFDYLETDCGAFDVIVLDLPDPDVDSLTYADAGEAPQLYDNVFWALLRQKLKAGGAVVSHAGPVMPGGDPEKRRAGLTWIQSMALRHLGAAGHTYHTNIPSFQGEWGFWMSCAPSAIPRFPAGLAVMDVAAQTYAFTWPAFWNSSYVGLVIS